MKTFALLLVTGLVLSSSLTAQARDRLAGVYGWKDGRNDVVVATVTETRYGLSIRFMRGCQTNLRYGQGAYRGNCVSGSGLRSVWYDAILGYKKGDPTLKWKGLEYGDDALGFDEYSFAYKLNE